MGGDLRAAPEGKSPSFLVATLKDPLSGNPDRIEIIKGWLDKKGELHEQVYDVVWADAEKRKPGKDGKLPPVGNTVDVKAARLGKAAPGNLLGVAFGFAEVAGR